VQAAIAPTSLLKGQLDSIVRSFRDYVVYNEIGEDELRAYIAGLENYGVCEVVKFRSLVGLEETSVIGLAGENLDARLPLRVY
jgi:hypothetical protein